MKRWKRGLKRITAIALSAILAGTTVDMTAFTVYAAESMQSELCEHHTEHTEDCGYVEAQDGSDCNHEHGEECYSENTTCVHNHDGECGYAEAVEDSDCTHECSEESGCITLKEKCSHSHDDTCGYKEVVEGSPCTFVCDVCESEEEGTLTCTCTEKCVEGEVNSDCAICSAEDADLTACTGQEIPAEPVCTCETDDPAFHATNCPAYKASENPECYCVEKCTEPNVWCEICGFDYTACGGTDTAAAYADGDSVTLTDSDSDGYYEIGNADELYAFAALVNGGETSANAILTDNIVVNENVMDKITVAANGTATVNDGETLRNWTPIGYHKSDEDNAHYTGTFDGKNFTVSGLYVNNYVNYGGLFGYVGEGGTLKNVGVVDSYICDYYYIGGVVGYNDGTVTNCYNTGFVTGDYMVGGVVGQNYHGSVSNCYNTGTVNGSYGVTHRNIGGVVGSNS